MIVDCHCHTGATAWPRPWNTGVPIEPYLRRAHTADIGPTAVFSIFHSDHEQGKRQVARLVARTGFQTLRKE